ncbi:MAG: N-acetylmuramoyl-L-alanine amidase [Woeseiaceae bacterium]|nr:N-acetylmuramoyl-L-alanine amidase [Woeseiaceae bacterium]
MKKLTVILFVCLMTACSSVPMIDSPSTNEDSRIQLLILHFTSEDFAESMRLLATPVRFRVSVHYVVPEPGDDTYPRDKLVVHRLVDESRRARHAGISYWAGRQNLNDASIGIEIVNRSACVSSNPDAEEPAPEDQDCTFLDYPEEQLQLVIDLCKDILARNPEIDPVDVISHGDIASNRRVDPGPQFPWKRLYENGIGAWYDDETVEGYRLALAKNPRDIDFLQRAINLYGYDLDISGENDLRSRFAVRAFQIHFRPEKYDGIFDRETAAILLALLEKYRPNRLEALLQETTG